MQAETAHHCDRSAYPCRLELICDCYIKLLKDLKTQSVNCDHQHVEGKEDPMSAWNMIILYSVSLILLTISFIANKHKTKAALKKALEEFLKLARPFCLLIVLVAISLYFFSEERISDLLGQKAAFSDIIFAALLGSVAALPGFIAFPMAGVLRGLGVAWSVIAAFTNSLMLVGVLTFPLERRVLGTKGALMRNIACFAIAVVAAAAIGLVLGDWF